MLSKLIVSLLTLIVVFGSTAGAQAADAELRELRAWTDSTGQYQVQAAFIELRDDRVWLRKADGSTVGVPLDRLSAADQGWVARQTVPSGLGLAAASAEWLTFRGPNRDGKSPDQGLLKEWPEGGPKLLWKVTDIGKGWAGVAVAGGTVYITGDVDDKLLLFAFDLDGQLKWKVDNGDKCDRGGYSVRGRRRRSMARTCTCSPGMAAWAVSMPGRASRAGARTRETLAATPAVGATPSRC